MAKPLAYPRGYLDKCERVPAVAVACVRRQEESGRHLPALHFRDEETKSNEEQS